VFATKLVGQPLVFIRGERAIPAAWMPVMALAA
jgi:hypothetical protein